MDPRIEQEVLAAMAAQLASTLQTPQDLHSQVDATGYVDPEFFAREQERVTIKSWIPIARENALANPGDYVTTELAGDSIAVMRGDDGELGAFHDVCLHRGARILRSTCGHAESLRCPYHGFTYDKTGALISIPAPDSFEHVHVGDTLPRVRCESWRGWVWVSLGDEALDLGVELEDELANWPFEELTAIDSRTLEVPFGWKIGVEAFLEPFHVPEIHPRTANPLVDYRGMAVRAMGEHTRMALPFRAANAYSSDGVFGSAAAAAGIEVFPELNEAQRTAHFVYLIFPSTVLMLLPNHMLFLSFEPVGVDRCRMRYELLAKPATSDAGQVWLDSLKAGYDLLLEEDLVNLPWIQKGVGDSTFQRANIGGYEQRILHFRAALTRRMQR
jgi:phenylpropionate dioxygenase-like ring-hydroxylating dioxygenase large terminal subunit